MKKMLFPGLFLFVALFAVNFSAISQSNGKIEFARMQHDFGKINEEKGPVEVVFSFKNIGSSPISLQSVKASCGCTTPEWSREPVAPGTEGFVKAVYNPRNRPGRFHKTVTVRTDGQPEVVVLKIGGEVIPRPKGPADWYPVESGNLRYSSSHVAFGNVLHNGTDTASVQLYNQGNSPLQLDLQAAQLPANITVNAEKNTLQPQETIRLFFTFNAAQENDWGYVFGYLNLPANDTEEPLKRLNYSANIKEDFTAVSAEAEKPAVKFSKVKHNFGSIEQKTVVKTTFTVTNEGNAPLLIRKTKASCGCTATRPDKNELAPGESTEINVSFSSGNRTGKQKKSITVICNDPSKDVTMLWIEANVQEPADGKQSGK